MMKVWLQKTILGAAGLIGLGIGALMLFDPATLFGLNGVALGADPNLLSEIRAPGAALITLAAIVLAGAVRESMTRLAALIGLAVYLAYGVGRLVSIGLDGVPAESLIAAGAIEFVVGALCGVVYLGRPAPVAAARPAL